MIKQLTIGFLVLCFFTGTAGAYVAASPNYRLQSDSINFGGGLSNSDNYRLETTAGEVATGRSTTTAYSVRAGYQEMQEVYLAMTAPSQINLGDINISTTNYVSNGSGTWTVNTDNPAGYSMSVRASTDPALRSASDSVANYPGVTFDWQVPANQSYFGFTPEGNDIATAFLDNGSVCGSGSLETTDRCWSGISTSNSTFVQRVNRTDLVGSDTVIKFRAEVGSTRRDSQDQTSYQAALTVTILAE